MFNAFDFLIPRRIYLYVYNAFSRVFCMQNAPTQSLLSVVNGILDESLDRKNGEIPHVWGGILSYTLNFYANV